MLPRRQFLNQMGVLALGASLPAYAQGTPARVCWLSPTPASEGSPFLEELRRGLRELGHVEGRTLNMFPYWGEHSVQITERIMAEAIASNPALIVAQGSIAPLIAKMSGSIPVVFGYSGDPVEAGMIDSFAKPGRNLTGISYMSLDLVGKRIELLREALPSARRIACVNSPSHPGDQSERRATQAAATKLGVAVQYFDFRPDNPLPEILAAIERARVQAVLMFPTQNITAAAARIAAWSQKTRLPTISGWAQFADAGNFMSYGPNLGITSRRLAFFADKILKGAKPADLPVELPTEVELVLNQRTAQALGVTVPNVVLLRASRVIA